jgi:hypothetical protein
VTPNSCPGRELNPHSDRSEGNFKAPQPVAPSCAIRRHVSGPRRLSDATRRHASLPSAPVSAPSPARVHGPTWARAELAVAREAALAAGVPFDEVFRRLWFAVP